jgi:hypothetical protein
MLRRIAAAVTHLSLNFRGLAQQMDAAAAKVEGGD